MKSLANKHHSGHEENHRKGDRRTSGKTVWSLGKEMHTISFRYSCRKMEAATREKTGWIQVICRLRYVRATRHKLNKVSL